jgi:hypothetical protein
MYDPILGTPWGRLSVFPPRTSNADTEKALFQMFKQAYFDADIHRTDDRNCFKSTALPNQAAKIMWNVLAARYTREAQK